jgi:hypothetical protein
MMRLLTHSDIKLIRSAKDGKRFLLSSAPTPPSAGAGTTANRADRARLSDRDLQALWSSKLSLCRRAWARTQTIFVDDRANRRAPTSRLCAEHDLPKGCRVSCQLPHATGNAQRDLRDQCRASAPSRESRLNGPGCCGPRFCQGGRHHRQHDRILSCCWRHAAQHGKSRAC